MADNLKQNISNDVIDTTISEFLSPNIIDKKKEKIVQLVIDKLTKEGYSKEKLNNKTQFIGQKIDEKQFNKALDIISDILRKTGTNIFVENYDGIIVKKLPDSDIIPKNKNKKGNKQTDIRPSKNQINMFPSLTPPKSYLEESKINNSLKNFFILEIPVSLNQSNLDFLKNKVKSNKEDKLLNSSTTALIDNMGGRMEISSQMSLDGDYFSELRSLLYEDDYLIILKIKEEFNYEAYGLKIKDNLTGEYLLDENGNLLIDENKGLKDLHKCFFYLNTKTLITPNHFSIGNENELQNNIDLEENEKVKLLQDNIHVGENILLYGVPGSGKSWTIEKEYCNIPSLMERVVFHPDYTYGDFVGQILPKVTEDTVTYEFTPGPFTSILKKAYEHPDKMYYLIIEEINRGNAPAIFGDIFQLLDRKEKINEENDNGLPLGTSEYEITNSDIAKIVYEDENHKVRIPFNLSIIATMNTSDQNVFTLDTAFQRRWKMRMIENDLDNPKLKINILDTDIKWNNFCKEINKLILEKNASGLSSEDKRLGAYFVTKEIFEVKGDFNIEDEKTKSKVKQFSEKVLKYLWDDAFKFSRDEIFVKKDDEEFSLEYYVKEFNDSEGLKRFNIFKEPIRSKFIKNDEESKEENDNDSQ